MLTETYTTPSARTTITLFAILMLFGIGALMFEGRSVSSALESGGLSIWGGVQKTVASIQKSISSSVTSISELARLRKQHLLLVGRLQELEKNLTNIEELYQENIQLREALQFSSAIRYSNTTALIIAKDPGNLFSTLTINKGTKHGIQRNDPVIAIQDGQQGLVGKISQTGHSTSIIQPIFDSRSFAAVRLRESRHEGVAAGTGNPNSPLELQFIPLDAREDIRSGDSIITSGLSSIFPSGIMVGSVTSLEAMPYETSLTIRIKPTIDFSKLEIVYVLQKEGQP